MQTACSYIIILTVIINGNTTAYLLQRFQLLEPHTLSQGQHADSMHKDASINSSADGAAVQEFKQKQTHGSAVAEPNVLQLGHVSKDRPASCSSTGIVESGVGGSDARRAPAGPGDMTCISMSTEAYTSAKHGPSNGPGSKPQHSGIAAAACVPTEAGNQHCGMGGCGRRAAHALRAFDLESMLMPLTHWLDKVSCRPCPCSIRVEHAVLFKPNAASGHAVYAVFSASTMCMVHVPQGHVHSVHLDSRVVHTCCTYPAD